jgi:hypothetical protein
MGERVTPKRSTKRRGPAKKYAPETTDVTPVKKPRRKAIPKKGAKFTVQVSTAPTVVAVPEYPTPSASPLDEKDELSRLPAYFQSCSSKMMEEYERMRDEIERMHGHITNLLVERNTLINKIKEQENQSDNEFMDQISVLVQNYKLKKRGSRIVHDAIAAAGVPESDVQTQPAYPVRQLEQVVYYFQPQSSQQAPEPYRGVKDVLFSAPGGMQKKVAMPVSSLNSYQNLNHSHQNFN